MKQIQTIKFNSCTRFLFPLLGVDKNLFNYFSQDNLGIVHQRFRYINTYLKDSNITHLTGNYLFILHSNFMTKDFCDFEKNIYACKNFFDSYDICQGHYGVKVFSVPDEFEKDYLLICNGKYSEISALAKQIILSKAIADVDTTLKILNKDKTIKEQWEETLSLPNSIIRLNNLDVWPIMTDKYQYEKETISNKLIEILYKRAIIPNKEF